MVVVDCYPGLNPDLIGRVSGLVQSGGALLLICPELNDWAAFPDPEISKLTAYPGEQKPIISNYLERWVRLLRELQGIEHYSPDTLHAIPPVTAHPPSHAADQPCTTDQQQAVQAVIRTACGKRRRPAILRASRGRGKSAALGLACGQLIATKQACRIIVTASGFRQAGTVFKHAQAVLSGSSMRVKQKCLHHSHGQLRYVAADLLIETPQECDLLIVDEASTLGVARLESLLKIYPRIAFAGTEHGYEGSGRGFALKFQQLIDTRCRGKRELIMQHPVRWAEDDPLEQWINRLLMLDIETSPSVDPVPVPLTSLNFHSVDTAVLARNEEQLGKIFGLLIDAHYQTRPVDCRHLLDSPNTQVWIAQLEEEPLGLVWTMHEGALDPKIARQVVAGMRRPQGHLVPQVLGAHLGLDEALTLRCKRIQRIAVKPELQGQGIGRWMLTQLDQKSRKDSDYLASSFGVNLPLARFWNGADYIPVRVGDRSRAASGLHSALVLKALSEPSAAMLTRAKTNFAAQFYAQISRHLNGLSPELVFELAQDAPIGVRLNQEQIRVAVLFSFAKRPFESSLEMLIKVATAQLYRAPGGCIDSPEFSSLLICRVLQLRPWSECAEITRLSGKKACITLLRQGIRELLEQHYPDTLIAGLRADYGV